MDISTKQETVENQNVEEKTETKQFNEKESKINKDEEGKIYIYIYIYICIIGWEKEEDEKITSAEEEEDVEQIDSKQNEEDDAEEGEEGESEEKQKFTKDQLYRQLIDPNSKYFMPFISVCALIGLGTYLIVKTNKKIITYQVILILCIINI